MTMTKNRVRSLPNGIYVIGDFVKKRCPTNLDNDVDFDNLDRKPVVGESSDCFCLSPYGDGNPLCFSGTILFFSGKHHEVSSIAGYAESFGSVPSGTLIVLLSDD